MVSLEHLRLRDFLVWHRLAEATVFTQASFDAAHLSGKWGLEVIQRSSRVATDAFALHYPSDSVGRGFPITRSRAS